MKGYRRTWCRQRGLQSAQRDTYATSAARSNAEPLGQARESEDEAMNGAEILLQTAAAAGIDTCFANPGTTELPLVGALDHIKKIRPVLCLAEAVCAGASDGFARISGKPALTILHLGPGLANGLAYFHNARSAATPIVN